MADSKPAKAKNEDANAPQTLIRQIEKLRNSRVIAYITSDRPPLAAQIGDDAVRVILDHLMALPQDADQPIDLFLYSRGGEVTVPWPLVTTIREFCSCFRVIVPYRAHSAATMICLGADEIQMLRKAELGPIDPSLIKGTSASGDGHPLQISVEDVTSFIAFIRDRAGMTDQAALAATVSLLAQQVTPLTLGTVNRLHSHIRLVARKLLARQSTRPDEERISTIIDSLTEKMYSHGHAIGRKEASELGLPIVNADAALEDLGWRLYLAYEAMLKLTEPLDPESTLLAANQDKLVLTTEPIAVIESAAACHLFAQTVELTRVRNTPANPQINVNLTLGLPAGFDPVALPAEAQCILQDLLSQAAAAVPGLVAQELARQSPPVGFQMRGYGGMWRKSR